MDASVEAQREADHRYVYERLRLTRGLWLAVARGTGIPKKTISKFAAGEVRFPRPATMAKLVAYFREQERIPADLTKVHHTRAEYRQEQLRDRLARAGNGAARPATKDKTKSKGKRKVKARKKGKPTKRARVDRRRRS